MKKLSIIVPVYYNEENLLPLYNDLREKVLSRLPCDYELILVDDGSKDRSPRIVDELARLDAKIIPLHLSRNFGEHGAILAGMSVCTGDCAVRKAADLQEPSELILEMLQKQEEGYPVVLAARAEREEGAFQRFTGKFYAGVMRKLAFPNMPEGGFDSFLVDRQIIDRLVAMDERNTSLMSQILWCGFRTATVPYRREKRQLGRSRWTFSKKVKLFIDSILSFSYFPIRLMSGIGLLTFCAAFVGLIVALVRKLCGIVDVEGYTSLMIVMLMGFGIVMLSIGILGEYLWRTFDAARHRAPYIIDRSPRPESEEAGESKTESSGEKD